MGKNASDAIFVSLYVRSGRLPPAGKELKKRKLRLPGYDCPAVRRRHIKKRAGPFSDPALFVIRDWATMFSGSKTTAEADQSDSIEYKRDKGSCHVIKSIVK